MKEHLNTGEGISNTEEQLKKFYTIFRDILDNYLEPTRTKEKKWMTHEILEMKEDRRKVKINDARANKITDKEIISAIRLAK